MTELQSLTTERRPSKYLRTFFSFDSEFYKLKMEGVALKWTKCTTPGCAKVKQNDGNQFHYGDEDDDGYDDDNGGEG